MCVWGYGVCVCMSQCMCAKRTQSSLSVGLEKAYIRVSFVGGKAFVPSSFLLTFKSAVIGISPPPPPPPSPPTHYDV